jgi:hypothetical protein
MKTPKLELRSSVTRSSPGEVFIVDENNHIVASFRVRTPDCHFADRAERENYDASINLDAAKWLLEEIQRRWQTDSYARFLPDDADHLPGG